VPLLEVDAGEVTLLIGTDQGDMHEVYEHRSDLICEISPKGNLTVFGWTVTGDMWPAMSDDDFSEPSDISPLCLFGEEKNCPQVSSLLL
jgi:hypothetical protein